MNNQIECPKCGHNFDVEEVITSKIQLDLEAKYKQLEEEKARELEQERLNLDKMKEEFQKRESAQQELGNRKVKEELQNKKK